MQEIKVKIIDPVGLHARPAAALVQVSSKFKSEISIVTDTKTANAKSIISIMALGIKKDSVITIQANGDDESVAISTIKKQLTDSKIIA